MTRRRAAHTFRSLRGALILAVLTLAAPADAAGQESVPWADMYADPAFYAAAHTTSNALMAGAQVALRGGSVADIGEAFLGGALGGLMTHLGMRTSASLRDAPVVGLAMVSAGASVTRNAGHQRPLFEDLSIVLPPVILRVRKEGEGWTVRPRLSLNSAIALGCMAFGSRGANFDLGRTLASGHPAFSTGQAFASDAHVPCIDAPSMPPAAFMWAGLTIAPDGTRWSDYVAHENVHLGQYVRDLVLIKEPLSDWALGGPAPEPNAGVLRRVARFIVFDNYNPSSTLDSWMASLSGAESATGLWINRFSEREAQALSGQKVCGRGTRACRW